MAYPTLKDFTSGALQTHASTHGGVQDDCDICNLYLFVATMFDHSAPRGLDTPLTGYRWPDLHAWLARAEPDSPTFEEASSDAYTRGYQAGMDDGLHYGRDAIKAQHPGPPPASNPTIADCRAPEYRQHPGPLLERG